MFDAVPCGHVSCCRYRVPASCHARILPPTSWPPGTLDPWELHDGQHLGRRIGYELKFTKNEGDHGSAIASRLGKALDELLDLPYLDVLLRLVLLRCTAHIDNSLS
jgi:hypothetical protein